MAQARPHQSATTPADRLAAVRARIAAAERAADRPAGAVTLVAVAKTRNSGEIRDMADAGVRHVGENYLQEALGKQDALTDPDLCWHFIGAVQSNKTRILAERFAWVHTVERLKIARRLSAARPAELPPLNLCVQVNLDAEPTKAGIAPEAAAELVAAVAELPRVRMRGLMAIPAPRADAAAQREAFARLARLAASLPELDVLSMGMSDDLEAAVAAGATHVRIGTALFGPRGDGNRP